MTGAVLCQSQASAALPAGDGGLSDCRDGAWGFVSVAFLTHLSLR